MVQVATGCVNRKCLEKNHLHLLVSFSDLSGGGNVKQQSKHDIEYRLSSWFGLFLVGMTSAVYIDNNGDHIWWQSWGY